MINSFNILEIKDPDIIKKFIINAGSSLQTFRYFEKRDFSIIHNHIVTLIGYNNNEFPIGYGHLEEENDKIWLGIAISENYVGKGFGKSMLQALLNFALEKKINEIYLSVDCNNYSAINLYLNNGFVFDCNLSENIQLMKYIINEHLY